MWPGREVKSEIGDEHFRLMLEVWLAKMARGSQAKGQGGKRKETGSTSSAGTAESVRRTIWSKLNHTIQGACQGYGGHEA